VRASWVDCGNEYVTITVECLGKQSARTDKRHLTSSLDVG